MPLVPFSDDPFYGPAMRVTTRLGELYFGAFAGFTLNYVVYEVLKALPRGMLLYPLLSILMAGGIYCAYAAWIVTKRARVRLQELVGTVPGADDAIRETLVPVIWLRNYALIYSIFALLGYVVGFRYFISNALTIHWLLWLVGPIIGVATGWVAILAALVWRAEPRRRGVVILFLLALLLVRPVLNILFNLVFFRLFIPTGAFDFRYELMVIILTSLPIWFLWVFIKWRGRQGVRRVDALWGIHRIREGEPVRVDLSVQ
jgi:hypothetical protein